MSPLTVYLARWGALHPLELRSFGPRILLPAFGVTQVWENSLEFPKAAGIA